MARPRSSFAKTVDYKSWAIVPSSSTDFGTAAIVVLGGLAFSLPQTILRIRGNFCVAFDGASDAQQTVFGLGVGLVSTDAFNTAGAVPGPLSDADYPWLYWQSIPLKVTLKIAAEAADDVMASFRADIDSKAMRKVKPNMTLCYVIEQTVARNLDVETSHLRVLLGT